MKQPREPKVCIACGRRDTMHPSGICGVCTSPTMNVNAIEQHDRGSRTPMDRDMCGDTGPSHYRCAPGPRDEREDLE